MNSDGRLNPVWVSAGLLILVGVVAISVKIIQTPKKAVTKPYFPTKIDSFCINKWCFGRDESVWLMDIDGQKVPADGDKVESFIKEIGLLRLESVVSNNPESFDGLGLGDKNGVRVRAGDKEIIVGNLGQDYQSTMVRIPGASEAYLAEVVWNQMNLLNEKYWEKYRVTNLPSLQIVKITVNGKELKATDEVKNRLTHLEASSYISSKIEKIVNRFDYVIEDEKEKTSLSIGRGKLGSRVIYWATTDEKYYFEINKSDFTLLTTVSG